MEPEVQQEQQPQEIEQQEPIQEQQQLSKDPLDMSEEEFADLESSGGIEGKLPSQPETETSSTQTQLAQPTAQEPDKDITFYKNFYDQMTAPLKAVKGYVTITDANDLRGMVSRGLDYTKKTQELSKYRSTIKFLEKNDLLDDTKLSFLSDVAKYDKAAIRKLITDATSDERGENKIDYYDLNPYSDYSDEPEYVLTNKNTYTDAQIALEEKVNQILSNEDGKAFINRVAESYDQTSINEVMKHPQILEDLYDLNKLGELGNLEDQVANYKALYPDQAVGSSDLQLLREAINTNQKALQYLQSKYNQAPAPQQGVKYGTRTYQQQTNNAKAAAIPRGTGGKNGHYMKDPLDMGDEEFAKAYGM